jgi:hypothetical protein
VGSWTGDRAASKDVEVRAVLDDAPLGCVTAQRDSLVRLHAGARSTVELRLRGCAALKVDVDPRDARLVFTPLDGGVALRVRADSASGVLLVHGRYSVVASLPRCVEYTDTLTAAPGVPGDSLNLRVRLSCGLK